MTRWTLLLAMGCGSSTSFTGQAVDPGGAPVEGALVTVVGTLCQARTDAQGSFDLSCAQARGDARVSIGQTGYVSLEQELSVADGKAHPLGTLVLDGIPEAQGVSLRRGASYEQPPVTHLVKALQDRPETVASFCLSNNEAEAWAVDGTELVVFDKQHTGWRLWRVEDDGCVYKKTRIDRGEWERTLGDKLEPSIRDVGSDQRIASFTLEPGRYFLGNWANGFFAPDDSVDAAAVHYAGHLIRVAP